MDAKDIVTAMTLEEKCLMLSGADYWHTKAAPRLGLASIMVADGPHGLRKQDGQADNVGLLPSVPATCFPTAAATGSSFDIDLLEAIGNAIGEEALDQGVSVVLGPGVNIKRSPLCGRNFEYFSEDPLLSGKLAAAWINGLQSNGVGSCLKHFAANNQEYCRMISNSLIDERALREIYLSGFEIAVKQAQPWTVMCSYNLLNGVYASDNRLLLDTILRDEWHFQGLTMSDWGAVNSRVDGVASGLDLEMPYSNGYNDSIVLDAAKSGRLSEQAIDTACERVVSLVLKGLGALRKPADIEVEVGGGASSQGGVGATSQGGIRATSQAEVAPLPGFELATCDYEAHHALARRAAAESCVLLKNEDALLPLARKQSLALIGAFAREPRYQGTGSSKVHPRQLECAYSELEALGFAVTYAPGYSLAAFAKPDSTLIATATDLASQCDVALVFAGLPDELETEGADRLALAMPPAHNQLIEAVAAANPNTVVVLSCGAPVQTPWADKVKAILVSYLGGEAGGGGVADLLAGRVCASGKLAETWFRSLEDTPAYSWFPAELSGRIPRKDAEYRESLFVGYRYADLSGQDPAWPFGFGLSYTSFAFDDLELSADTYAGGELRLSFTLTNTGACAGAEVVQVYSSFVSDPAAGSGVFRPRRELRAFTKVFLAAGESTRVELRLDERSFSYYNTAQHAWAREAGDYLLAVGASSRDIRLSATIHATGDGLEEELAYLRKQAPIYFELAQRSSDGSESSSSRAVNTPLDIPDEQFAALLGYRLPLEPRSQHSKQSFDHNTVLGDIEHKLIGRILIRQFRAQTRKMLEDGGSARMTEAVIYETPLRSMVMMSGGAFPANVMNAIINLLNGKYLSAIKNLLRSGTG